MNERKPPPDNSARRRILTALDETLLVEAAAGTGKTSLLAGRVTMLLASGALPSSIAAITFTELAAAELRVRVEDFVASLAIGKIPEDLEPAFPDGINDVQKAFLERARHSLGELAASTIHSFCLSILLSYAVDAGIDPGAAVMDQDQRDLAFHNVFDTWLRRRLGEDSRAGDPVAIMATFDPEEAVRTLEGLAKARLDHRGTRIIPHPFATEAAEDFKAKVQEFRRWINPKPAPEEALQDLSDFEELASFYENAFEPLPSFERLWRLAHPPRVGIMKFRGYDLRVYRQRLGKWRASAGDPSGPELSAECEDHYSKCANAFTTLLGEISETLLALYSGEVDELIVRFEQFKLRAAVLDFDDVLIGTRTVLKSNDRICGEVARRYSRILIDEFQDTDPVQAEILFLIAGAAGEYSPWHTRPLRPGVLFMVGDPKQAIYRFRGADLDCYIQARTSVERQFPGNIVQVAANFRSRKGILDHVNECFKGAFEKQTGTYVALESVLEDLEGDVVAKISLDVTEGAWVENIRDQEARIVAEVCGRLIGNIVIRRSNGEVAPAAPRDIALLVPAGTDLWRYERALEEEELPFTTLAGKNLIRRQESQDFVILVRVLADSRDTLALGALLRGPLVGLTEHTLLDIAQELEERTGSPVLSLKTDPALIPDPVARSVVGILRALRLKIRSTTPYQLLSAAIERLNVKAALMTRSLEQRERAFANLTLLLERSRAYDVRGFAQLAIDLDEKWSKVGPEEEAIPERSDDAINIVTMHKAKGLEWPIVIPINLASEFERYKRFIYRSDDQTLHWSIGDIVPPSLRKALVDEQRQQREEAERLLYVACTRAMDLLVLLEPTWSPENSWGRILDLGQGKVSEIALRKRIYKPSVKDTLQKNLQTKEIFESERAIVAEASPAIRWRRPSDGDLDRQILDAATIMPAGEDNGSVVVTGAGSARGVLLHKLMEEILSDQLEESEQSIVDRAEVLLGQLTVPNDRPDPVELAARVLGTLALPPIAESRGKLVPEVPLFGMFGDTNELLSGRADAVVFEDGQPSIVFDWKSDIAPDEDSYRAHAGQLLDYLKATGLKRGALVYMTKSLVQWVEAPD